MYLFVCVLYSILPAAEVPVPAPSMLPAAEVPVPVPSMFPAAEVPVPVSVVSIKSLFEHYSPSRDDLKL